MFVICLTRWAYKPSCDIWSLLGKEAVLDQGHFLHGNAMPRSNPWCWGVVKGFQPSKYELLGGGANVVNHGYTKGDGLGAEIVGTFVLVYTVFSATDAKRDARDSHIPVSVSYSRSFLNCPTHLRWNVEVTVILSLNGR